MNSKQNTLIFILFLFSFTISTKVLPLQSNIDLRLFQRSTVLAKLIKSHSNFLGKFPGKFLFHFTGSGKITFFTDKIKKKNMWSLQITGKKVVPSKKKVKSKYTGSFPGKFSFNFSGSGKIFYSTDPSNTNWSVSLHGKNGFLSKSQLR